MVIRRGRAGWQHRLFLGGLARRRWLSKPCARRTSGSSRGRHQSRAWLCLPAGSCTCTCKTAFYVHCPTRVASAVITVFGDSYVDRSHYFVTPDCSICNAVAAAERRRTFWQLQMLHCSVSAYLLNYRRTCSVTWRYEIERVSGTVNYFASHKNYSGWFAKFIRDRFEIYVLLRFRIQLQLMLSCLAFLINFVDCIGRWFSTGVPRNPGVPRASAKGSAAGQ